MHINKMGPTSRIIFLVGPGGRDLLIRYTVDLRVSTLFADHNQACKTFFF